MYKNSKKIIIFIFFFISITMFCNDSNNLFYLGIQDEPYAQEKIDGVSINDIFIDMFKNHLKLDVVEVKNSWSGTYKNLIKGETYALGLVNRKISREKYLIFSKPIFNENLYVVSAKKKLNSYKDLDKQRIYIYRGDPNLNDLKRFLKLKDIEVEIVEVKNIDDYKDELYLDSEFTTYGMPNKIFISNLPSVSIGINKKYQHLLPLVNKALDEKYSAEISNLLNKKSIYYQRNEFLKKLTPEEKESLKTMKTLITGYEDDLILSMYSIKKQGYMGIIPTYLNKLSKITGIKIENKYKPKISWEKILNDFSKNKIDILALSKTKKNEQKYIFTIPIDHISMYLVSSDDKTNDKIGVIKDGKSEDLANLYFSHSNIVSYGSVKELRAGLINYEVGRIITTFFVNLKTNKKFRTEKIEVIPVNFALNNKNIILKSILDKAISTISEYDKIQLRTEIKFSDKENILSMKYKMTKYILINIIVAICLIVIFLAFFYKIKLNRKMRKLLRYDVLTNLQNRYTFKEVCESKKNESGMIAILDLDNFKSINDIYGHSIGDIVLIKVGAILLKTFGEKSCFRISGDEFYILEQDINYGEKIKNFIKNCEESKTLAKYNATISFGYTYKEEKDELENSFKIADKAMYEAKKLYGFSVVYLSI